LIRDAWGTTWRNRYLWVLALFAGGAVGVSGKGGFGPPKGIGNRVGAEVGERGWGRGDWGDVGPFGAFRRGEWRLEETQAHIQGFIQNAVQWATANAGLIVAVAVLVALLAVGLVALGLIARGGMAEATVDLATGGSSSGCGVPERGWRGATPVCG
jgi:hypothetical protein